MRPIDADALMRAMYHRAFETDDDTMWQSGCWVRYRAVEQVIKDQPTVVEPERKTGRWILSRPHSGNATCSECRTYQWDVYDDEHWQNYCGHCGVKMEGTDG